MATVRRLALQWLSWVARPCDVAWLVAFRAFYGLSMAVSAQRFIANGWIDRLFVEPSFHFKYYGFHWVESPSRDAIHLLFWVMMGLGLAVATGFLFRLSMSVFLALFTYVQLIDVSTYLNHYYLAVLLGFLLLFSPAGRAGSIDVLLWPKRRIDTVPQAWLALFRFQVIAVYGFAALAKLGSDWLLHAQPLRIWLGARSDLPLLGPLLSFPISAWVMSWAGFLFDATVTGFLSFRRTRPFAFVAVVLFHVLTRALFSIGMFPVIMITSALVFFAPSWPRWLWSKLSSFGTTRLVEQRRASERIVHGAASPLSRLALGLGLVYVVVQLVIPLRFLAYGGDVRWHEQGMRFSWRVMVREKNGSVTFHVKSPTAGRVWQLTPSRYLTSLQEREMASQPDLVLQLAKHVREDFRARGYADVEVRAEALVSLNGRRLAPLVDPNVDLARVEDGVGKAHWILPAPTEPPPRLRPLPNDATPFRTRTSLQSESSEARLAAHRKDDARR
jgi:vitamin K-dependent gamma-carboxylase